MSSRSDQQFDKLLANPLFEREELMLLAFARKTLTAERWHKGSVRNQAGPEPDDETDPICIQGALLEVMRTNGFSTHVKRKAEALINVACEEDRQNFRYQNFNDKQETKYEDVQRVITLAITLGLKQPELTTSVK